MTDSTHLTETPMASFGLAEPLMRGVRDAGFDRCTPIQAETLPRALRGESVAGQAQTGTGKTAAFLLATMHYLLTHEPDPGRKPNQPRAIILAPTRELAVQIHKDAQVLGRHTGLTLGLAYGGTGYESQRRELEAGVDILIGTPGRIIDYFKQKVFDLRQIQVAVLDEADRMFDLGFIKDIRFLLRRMPPAEKRLNLLFSATLSYRVIELAFEHMDNPYAVRLDTEHVTAERVHQRLYHVASDEKIPLLLGLLRGMEVHRMLIFVNTKRAGDRLLGYLKGNGIQAEVLSGDVPQRKRQQLLEDFRAGRVAVLVATDVAARGLHIPDVSHVVNFDLPQDAEDYVHRIGRTARAGAEGDAISLCCEQYCYSLPDIEAFIGEKIPADTATGEMMVTPEPPVPIRRHGGRGKPSGKSGNGRGRGRRRRGGNGGEQRKVG
ncbi:MAG TPA: DEAD/DEAH box helicase [Gammaproteobacteria bacterium]|nr:DEAD/DEAH box helicase [Gammaproteobacteria bacterium]